MEMSSREMMEKLAGAVMAVLLVVDARRAVRDRRIVFGLEDLGESKAKM
jgi:hypothetical protein